jgi:hypothetical protein
MFKINNYLCSNQVKEYAFDKSIVAINQKIQVQNTDIYYFVFSKLELSQSDN